MARLTDHDVRDAQDALRKEVSLLVNLYIRRILEMGKAHIQEAIETAIKEDRDVNGTAIGREAAEKAARDYFGGLAGSTFIHQVIEGSPAGLVEAAEDPEF